ncbi:MAG: tail fiber protein [Magnetococcales bacterium]|nr:tail fiber protein [Magnetococcales bacterium]
MADPFIGQITIMAGSYAPKGHAFCDGQILSIQQNPELYSIIGIGYGGDGRSTFGVPDMRGRAPLGAGFGTGLTPHPFNGNKYGGEPLHTLSVEEIPSHTHTINTSQAKADLNTPSADTYVGRPQAMKRRTFSDFFMYSQDFIQEVQMSNAAMGAAGASQPHENRQPFSVLSFVIALAGTYPQHS